MSLVKFEINTSKTTLKLRIVDIDSEFLVWLRNIKTVIHFDFKKSKVSLLGGHNPHIGWKPDSSISIYFSNRNNNYIEYRKNYTELCFYITSLQENIYELKNYNGSMTIQEYKIGFIKIFKLLSIKYNNDKRK